MSRAAAVLLWLSLVGVTFIAPTVRDNVGPWLIELCTGEWSAHEPWVVTHFWLMGVWPALFALLLRGEGPRSWPFRALAFVSGCYGLLPWFAWRTEPSRPEPSRAWATAAALCGAGAVGLVGWATVRGSIIAWAGEASADGFIFIMAFDFLAFWLASVLEVRAREGQWWWTLLPVIGLAVWLVRRDSP
jgi:hypothetical protein